LGAHFQAFSREIPGKIPLVVVQTLLTEPTPSSVRGEDYVADFGVILYRAHARHRRIQHIGTRYQARYISVCDTNPTANTYELGYGRKRQVPNLFYW
jgi:hypothetical protein